MFSGSRSSNMRLSQRFDEFKHQNPRWLPKWPPSWPSRWPLDMANLCNFTNNCLIDAKLVSIPMFSGSRNSNMTLSQSFDGFKHQNPRWLPRWRPRLPLDMANFVTSPIIVLLNQMQSWCLDSLGSRSSNMTLYFSQSFDGFKH